MFKEINRINPSLVEVPCDYCHRRIQVPLTDSQQRRWRGGQLIQYAAPELTPAQREVLISGVCGECFDRMTSKDALPSS